MNNLRSIIQLLTAKLILNAKATTQSEAQKMAWSITKAKIAAINSAIKNGKMIVVNFSTGTRVIKPMPWTTKSKGTGRKLQAGHFLCNCAFKAANPAKNNSVVSFKLEQMVKIHGL